MRYSALPVRERDWVVVGSTPEEMQRLGYRQVGRDFPVFLHPETNEEYALARTERKVGPGHTGFVCHAGPDVTLEDDLRRRDLTINAIAQAPDGTLIDPLGGAADLHSRRLRHVSEAFVEDPLRVFRVARFAAQLARVRISSRARNAAIDDRHVPPRSSWQNSLRNGSGRELAKTLSTRSPGVFFDVLRAQRRTASMVWRIGGRSRCSRIRQRAVAAAA